MPCVLAKDPPTLSSVDDELNKCVSASVGDFQAIACYERAIEEADGRLNFIYLKIKSVLRRDIYEKLRNSQRSWLKLREENKYILSLMHDGKQGSMDRLIYVADDYRNLSARISFLEIFYEQ